MASGSGSGGSADDGPTPAPQGAQIEFEPSAPRSPEEIAAEAAQREQRLRELVKTSLAVGSAKLTEVDRRATRTPKPR
jgi:hypothetical protein